MITTASIIPDVSKPPWRSFKGVKRGREDAANCVTDKRDCKDETKG